MLIATMSLMLTMLVAAVVTMLVIGVDMMTTTTKTPVFSGCTPTMYGCTRRPAPSAGGDMRGKSVLAEPGAAYCTGGVP